MPIDSSSASSPDDSSSPSPSSSLPSSTEARHHDRARMHFNSLNDAQGTSEHFKHLKPSILRPFFGSNVPEPTSVLASKRGEHPCAGYSRQVHQCLDQRHNEFTYCQTAVAAFNQCLNELDSK